MTSPDVPSPAWLLSALVLVLVGTTAACVDEEETFGQAMLDRVAAEARAALAVDPGLVLDGPVEAVLLGRDEALARRRAFARAQGEDASITLVAEEIAESVLGGSMLGRYLPDEKAIYVYRETVERLGRQSRQSLEDTLFAVLAHEYVHAFDDQHHDAIPQPAQLIGPLTQDPGVLVDVQTLMSLLEGRAAYLSERACLAAGRPILPMPSVEEALDHRSFAGDGTLLGDVTAGAGNAVARMKIVQYAYGRRFSEAAFRYGGLRFLDRVFEHLPLSADELETFELFRQRWAEELTARLEAEEAEEDGPVDAPDPDPAGADGDDP